jgi:hypothetical protein
VIWAKLFHIRWLQCLYFGNSKISNVRNSLRA